ncbi:hypothetical protein OA85_16920, partial [Flavobacterium sp. AED]
MLNPTNCDTATITIVVAAPVIDANDDMYSITNCSEFGVVGNIFANDTLNGNSIISEVINFSLVSGENSNITLDNIGNINVLSGIASGSYVLTYQICEKLNPNNCNTATITLNVTIANNIVTINSSICNDGEITTTNLSDLLPAGTPTNGTWIDVNNSGGLQGSILNASGLSVKDYIFEYKINDATCPRTIRVVMTV